jgi:hypothetical protein
MQKKPDKVLNYINVVPQLLDTNMKQRFKNNDTYLKVNAPKLYAILRNVSNIMDRHGGKQIIFSDQQDRGGAEGILELMLQRNFKLYPRTCARTTLHGGAPPPKFRVPPATFGAPPNFRAPPNTRAPPKFTRDEEDEEDDGGEEEDDTSGEEEEDDTSGDGSGDGSGDTDGEDDEKKYSLDDDSNTTCDVVNLCKGSRVCHQVVYLGTLNGQAMTPDELVRLLAAFNSPENATGHLIPVIILTSKYAEGVNFKGVRAIHFVEQQPKIGRFEQIVGRARRVCSHSELQFPNQWTVDVYQYMSVFPDGKKRSVEEQMYAQRVKGKQLKNDIINLAGSVAMDCLSNSLRTGFRCATFSAEELEWFKNHPPPGRSPEGQDDSEQEEDEDDEEYQDPDETGEVEMAGGGSHNALVRAWA